MNAQTANNETLLNSLYKILEALQAAHVHVSHCYGCPDISHMTPDAQRQECIVLVTTKIEEAEAQ